ncbi:19678_t:CDS:2 [Gigaspora rosea]|nr:19678_t:CDS:2 [Gigaspora rosea]
MEEVNRRENSFLAANMRRDFRIKAEIDFIFAESLYVSEFLLLEKGEENEEHVTREELAKVFQEGIDKLESRLKGAETSKLSGILQILKGMAEGKSRAGFFFPDGVENKLRKEDVGILGAAGILSAKKKNICLELLKKEKKFGLTIGKSAAKAVFLLESFLKELRENAKNEVDIIEEIVTKRELEKLVKEAEKNEEDKDRKLTWAEIGTSTI